MIRDAILVSLVTFFVNKKKMLTSLKQINFIQIPGSFYIIFLQDLNHLYKIMIWNIVTIESILLRTLTERFF